MDDSEITTLTGVEDRHWWFAERRVVLRRLVADLRPGVALDVGAAGGGNTRVLRDLGWHAVALEYSETGAQVARRRGLPTTRGDALALPLRSGSVDLVMALDVLEHLDDDATAARELARVLRPGGRALVAVPADPLLWSDHDVAIGHHRRYVRGSLDAVLRSAGLLVDEMWSWNVLLRPVVRLRRRCTGCTDVGPGEGSELDDVPPGLNGLLRACVMAERRLPFVRRMPGVTLMATAHRP
jgi:SAM-dependent methyltransferase